MSLAKLFHDQCVGSYSGHMSSIPNNPLFSSIFDAAGYSEKAKHPNNAYKVFADILRQFATELEAEALKKEEMPF